MSDSRPTVAEIDLSALRHNYAVIRRTVKPECGILAVVKADAYGHGLHQTVARLMHSGADYFAVANITEAAAVFDEIGSPLWVARAELELARLAAGSAGAVLTDSERQVADRAAAGLSNKEIATALFLSEKTVEMHLSNAYRKLGIRSRAQLAERLREEE